MWSRRRYRRFTVDNINMRGRMVFANDVRILNISLNGVSFVADRRLNIGCNYVLNMMHKVRDLNIKGIVIWSFLSDCKKGLHNEIIPMYTAGMKFTDVTKKKEKDIADFLVSDFTDDHNKTDFIEDSVKEVHKRVNVYRLSGLRIFIEAHKNAPEETMLNYNENFRVKELSLTDMLLECKKPLEIESRLNIKILLPEGKTIGVVGCVASCCMLKNMIPALYNIGIDFLDMSEKDWEILNGFIFLYDYSD